MSSWICLRLPGAGIFTDYLLLEVIQRRIGANAIRVRFATEFFLTRIYRIDTDTSLVGRYCLPDSRPFVLYNPETSSRATLASLGTGFQPDLPSMPLNNQKPTTHNPQPIYIYFYLLMFYDVWRGHYQLSEFHGSYSPLL